MTPTQETLLKKYADAVLTAPAHLHLTADREFDRFWNRHIRDAVQLHGMVAAFPAGNPPRVLDVGSGNGIPGIPFAILEPEWQIDMLDSDNKKCGFIDTFCKSHAIINAHVLVGRAESFARSEMRSTYNLVFSRALSKLRVALELTAAFVMIGGELIVPHGTFWKEELDGADAALKDLGLEQPLVEHYKLEDISYAALRFKKIAETSSLYPRAVGVPAKRPL